MKTRVFNMKNGRIPLNEKYFNDYDVVRTEQTRLDLNDFNYKPVRGFSVQSDTDVFCNRIYAGFRRRVDFQRKLVKIRYPPRRVLEYESNSGAIERAMRNFSARTAGGLGRVAECNYRHVYSRRLINGARLKSLIYEYGART